MHKQLKTLVKTHGLKAVIKEAKEVQKELDYESGSKYIINGSYVKNLSKWCKDMRYSRDGFNSCMAAAKVEGEELKSFKYKGLTVIIKGVQ